MKVETNKVVEIKAKYLTTEEYDQLMAMIQKNNDGNSQYFANATSINISSKIIQDYLHSEYVLDYW